MKLLQGYSYDSFKTFCKIPFIWPVHHAAHRQISILPQRENPPCEALQTGSYLWFCQAKSTLSSAWHGGRSSQVQDLSLTVALALQDTCCLSSISQSVFCFEFQSSGRRTKFRFETNIRHDTEYVFYENVSVFVLEAVCNLILYVEASV